MKDSKTFEQFKEVAATAKGKMLGVKVYSDLYEDYEIKGVEITEDEVAFLYSHHYSGEMKDYRYTISRENFSNFANSKNFPISSHYPEGVIVFMNPIGSVVIFEYKRPKPRRRDLDKIDLLY